MYTRMKRRAAAFTLALLAASSQAHGPNGLEAQIEALRAQMREMQQALQALQALQQAPQPTAAARQEGRAPQTDGAHLGPAVHKPAWPAAPTGHLGVNTAAVPFTAPGDIEEPRVSFFGYGEMLYTRPRADGAQAMATARRAVLGMAYRFNERTRLAAELEVENAVVSAGDQGELAFEQLYIEHDWSERVSAKLGLFLLPIGYMNQTHEPTRYLGVNRNLVETAIIPTTWRELGVGLQGRTEQGWRWNTGLVTSFDLTRWPSDAGQTRESPLGAIHQEGQLARAASAATYGALNYDGVPGLNVGGSLYSGGIAQKQMGQLAPQARVQLSELHTRWQPGRWDLSALAAFGRLSGVADFNASAVSAGNPVPDQFRGAYAQAAYRIWQNGDLSLLPFARYERVNTALGFSGLPQGLLPAPMPDARVMTLGASFYLHPQVVLKLDAQRHLENSQLDRFNLGLGFHY